MFNKKNDLEKSWLVKNAEFDKEDIPFIRTALELPQELVRFSQRNGSNEFHKWIHFFERDKDFICLWNNPKKYLPRLKKFAGIISPDLSYYADYPIPIQYQNKYRNHALSHWLSTKGVPVIPNVRWANRRSYGFCFRGVEKNSVVAIGTHGQMKSAENKKLFLEGLPVMMATLSPHTIIIYGKAPDEIWKEYSESGINIIQFPSEKETYHEAKKEATA
ncbi:MAG: DUF4417 domain-containing protein [Oscillospiraceae bacterium]|nr:DUF4417 domain-containing protein [Oscillospiraceae bacterium]MCL2278600.1 DUF4417 domain-containing protein [Oscillospiraceae bacterium]